MDQLDMMIAFEQGELSYDNTLELFAGLIKSGLAWKLQGFYGRYASELINGRYITQEGEIIDEPLTE